MRLTNLANRLTLAAAALTVAASAGCQRLPYLDQVEARSPRDAGHDRRRGQGRPPGHTSPARPRSPPPKVAKPRTTDNPEAQEIWQLRSRRRSGSAWITPRSSASSRSVPRASRSAASSRPRSTPGPVPASPARSVPGRSRSVYDPAIQETQIAQALAVFDTNFTTSMFWGHSVTPFNNGISAGTIPTPAVPDHLRPGHRRSSRRSSRSGPRPVPCSRSSTTSTISTRTAPATSSRRPTRPTRSSSSPSPCSAARSRTRRASKPTAPRS